MSQIRVKFATPLLHPKRSTTAKPPVQLNGPDLDSPHRTSQTYTVENLFGQIATAETPVLKEMLIAKRPNLGELQVINVCIYDSRFLLNFRNTHWLSRI